MKAISLWQPWASLIVLGFKEFETRSWWTGYRGPLLIHAAKRVVKSELEDLLDYDAFRLCLDRFAPKLAPKLTVEHLIENMPLGAIIGKVDLVDCVITQRVRDNLPERELLFGNYGDSRYAWQLAKPLLFDKPFPWKGSQGFFDVPWSPEDVEAYEEKLAVKS